MFNFFPRDEKFFEMFERASSNLNKAGQAFKDLLNDYTNTENKIKNIKDLEHEGDILTHEIFDKLNRTFITPIDREDIHQLTSEVDDVLDYILATADRLQLYKIKKPTPETLKLAEVLISAIEILGKAVNSLKDPKRSRRTLDYCVEINRLENEGDLLHKAAIAELFSDGKDAVEIIKWNDIYDHLESAIDMCEDVADTVEGIVVKNA
jgi:predicted phosphate transport protein (TIGR00153 family)